MADWKTRLVVKANGSVVTPIDSFSPTFALNTEVLHSIESTHIGAIVSPAAISFSMTVKAIGDAAAKLTTLAMQGTRFTVELQEGDGTDWSFASVVLSDCIITNATPSSAAVTGAPTATFSGFSLKSAVTVKGGQPIQIGAR